jgi:serine protease
MGWRHWGGWRHWAVLRRRPVWGSIVVALLLVAALVPLLRTASDNARLTQLPRPIPRADATGGGIVADPTQASPQASTETGLPGPQPGAETGAVGSRPSADPDPSPEYAPASVVVSLRDPADPTAVTSRGGSVVDEIAGTEFLEVSPAGDPMAFADSLAQDPDVVAVSLDYGRRKAATPNDELYPAYQRAYLDLVRMPEAWGLRSDAVSQVVAVLDTGVDSGHPDLAGRLVAGFNAVSPGSSTADTDGHGTFVAGVIAANTNNGTGAAGVTWNGRVMPVQVFAGELAFDSDIARGIVWATDHGAAVINMSLGGAAYSALLHAAVRYATERDVVVVASSGNDGSGVAQYPAAFPEVLAVGATDEAGRLVDFSSYGDWLDLAAPGFNVVSTVPGGAYAVGDGTSFAAPIVAGLAALVRSQSPALTQAQVGDRLRAAARDPGPRGFDPYYGWGVLDAARALGASLAADLPMADLGPDEPNDVPERATPISVTWNPGVQRSLDVEGDVDWYRYEATTRMEIQLWVEGPGPFDPESGQNLDLIIQVFDHGLGRVAVGGALGAFVAEVPEGPVFISVSNRNGAAQARPYTLRLGLGFAALDYYVQTLRMGTGIDPGPGLAALDIGDVTGDGRADVVVSTKTLYLEKADDNKIFVLPQQDGEALAPPTWYTPVQAAVPSLTLADIDDDARLDVVVAGSSGIEWFRQEPGGGLASRGMLPGVTVPLRLVTAGDLDNDGDTDLVAAPMSGALIVLTHGSGSSFTTSTVPNSSDTGNDIAVGDVDGDGRPDVVSTNGDLQVLHNEEDGWRRTDHVPVGGIPELNDLSSIAIADVTGDGLLDVLGTVNTPSGVVNVFRQTTDGTLADPVTTSAGTPHSVAIGDINGDSRDDLVVIDTPKARVLRQLGDGSLGAQLSVLAAAATYAGVQGIAIGHLDGDGLADVAYAGDTELAIIRHRAPRANGGGVVVRSVSPVEYSTGVALTTAPQVVFAPDVDASTVNGGTVRLVDGRTGAAVAASVSYDAGSRTATITPAAPLHRAKPYRVVVAGVWNLVGSPVLPFGSTFTTTNGGPLPGLDDLAVRGQLGTAVSVSATVPVGDLGDVIVRYAPGTTAPASPTAGSAGYAGVGGGIMVGGLSPGQTYSVAVWYRDRAGNLSPRSTATLIGTTLAMTGTSVGDGIATVSVTFTGTVATPAGPGAGVAVPLVAACADGPFGGAPVATATADAGGVLSVTLTLGSPRCSFRWEINNSTQFMGATTTSVRVTAGNNTPPGGPPPRER